MERHRALPSWMSKTEEKEKESPKRCRKRKVATSVFYCMNEKELVEAALSCLTSSACEDVTCSTDQQVGTITVTTREKPASLKTHIKPVTDDLDEDSSGCRDALETTCVSETDMDVTEVETLPYTDTSPLHQRQKSPTPGAVTQGHTTGMEAEQRRGGPQMEADALEEDEALKLVREIFFT